MRHQRPDRPRFRDLSLAGCLALCVLGACGQPADSPVPPPSPCPPPVPPGLEAYDAALVEAIRGSTRVLALEPQRPDAWLRLGKFYEAHQLYDFAAPAYEQAVARASTDPKAWYRLAIARSRNAELAPAIEAFDAVHRLAPDYAPAWRRHGDLLLEAGQAEEARRALARAKALARGRAVAPSGRDPWSSDLAQFEVACAPLIERAGRLLARGQAGQALAVLRPLEARGTGNVRAWRQLGDIYTALDQHALAARSLERACELQPLNAQGWLDAARAQCAADESQRAELSCARALELDPGLTPAGLFCADRLLAQGRPQEVVDLAHSHRFGGPQQAAFLTRIGQAYVDLKQPEEALLHFEKALFLQPNQPDALAGSRLVQAHSPHAKPE